MIEFEYKNKQTNTQHQTVLNLTNFTIEDGSMITNFYAYWRARTRIFKSCICSDYKSSALP